MICTCCGQTLISLVECDGVLVFGIDNSISSRRKELQVVVCKSHCRGCE